MNRDNPSTTSQLFILAGVMFVVTVAGLVALMGMGRETEALERLVGPLLSAIVVTGVLGGVTKQTNGKLDRIERQTNGVLDARIREGTREALTEAVRDGVISPGPAELDRAEHRRP